MSNGEVLETTPDGRMRLTLHIDDDPHNPREEYDHLEHMFTVDSCDAPGPLGYAWSHYRGRCFRGRDAVALFTRYAAWAGAVTLVWSPPRDVDRVFYLPAESLSEVGDPTTYLDAQAQEYAAWTDGECYGWVIEQRATWRRDDDHDATMETWEHVDSCWGFYGHAYAEESAREAWEAAVSAVSVR